MKKLIIYTIILLFTTQFAAGQHLYYRYHYRVIGDVDIPARYTEPQKIYPVDGWYTFEIENLSSFFISTTLNEEDGTGFMAGMYYFELNADNLGEQVVPKKRNSINDLPKSMPWVGDYRIEIAEDLSVAVFTPIGLYFKPEYPIFLKEYLHRVQRTFEFKIEDEYVYSYDFIGEDKLKAGSWIWISAPIPGREYRMPGDVEIVPRGKFTFETGVDYGYITLLEDFEGTITASHDGAYGSPMMVEFIPLHGGDLTSVEGVGISDASVRYFNLQGLEVEKPQCGVYVEVSNGKSRMVKL